jgi:hypothetical protein
MEKICSRDAGMRLFPQIRKKEQRFEIARVVAEGREKRVVRAPQRQHGHNSNKGMWGRKEWMKNTWGAGTSNM